MRHSQHLVSVFLVLHYYCYAECRSAECHYAECDGAKRNRGKTMKKINAAP
jgi:hypothetical protein